MKVKKITISEWRNFKDIELDICDDLPLICLVGSNGTGKSHLFELVSACAYRVGLSAGSDIPRGDPFADTTKSFSVTFAFPRGIVNQLDTPFGDPDAYHSWDRTITVHGENGSVLAGGINDQGQATSTANFVINLLRQSESVHYLTLDADRSFPKVTIQPHEYADTLSEHWGQAQWNKSRSSQTTRSLYEEWTKYFLSKEGKAANDFYKETRTASEGGLPLPAFIDGFASYKASVRAVMSHLMFAGVDTSNKTLEFDTVGKRLRFDQLSGGEREIAFLIGQIDRFGLTNGLFLLDEPELHLNPELIRRWVNYLTSTVENGQVWLATHSLEAVEAAGQSATILIERDEETRTVKSASFLVDQPVLGVLAKAIGSPAFSISSGRFFFIEGKQELGERDRFEKFLGRDHGTQFIESGSCNEVIKRIGAIKSLAEASHQLIRTAGIIDRDWRGLAEIRSLEQDGMIVLPVHEIENFMLHPATLNQVAATLGVSNFNHKDTLQRAADARAGGWIIQSATFGQPDISNIESAAWTSAYQLSWNAISESPESALTGIADQSLLNDPHKSAFLRRLLAFAKIYKRKRESEELWMICEGKEIAKSIATELGFRDSTALERAVVKQWTEWAVPVELGWVRAALHSI